MTHPIHRIRPLFPADHGRVAALIRDAFAAQGVATDPPSSALRETAQGVAAMDGGAVAIILDGVSIGVVLWAERERGLYIGRLAVAPAWRGRGIARALLGAADAEAQARGLPVVRLSTRLPLTGNRRLFAGCGYVETVLRAHPGYDRPTSVEMEKRLGPA